MSDKKYVLLYLDSIKVNIKETTTDPIVFCQSISVKLHDEQNIDLIEDWSDIIIGESSKYKGLKGVTEVAIAEFDEITGEYTGGINTNIGLWSVILFETIKNEEGEYTRLTINNAGSDGIGGAGEQESNIKEVYENTLSSINYQINECVRDFLKNIFSAEKYNGCMFINNPNCGLFLNISPKMFNEQENLKSIALTNTISYIADKGGATSGVFRDCIKLESANIPKHLDNYVKYNFDTNKYDIINPKRIVPSYYFHNCESLEKITIPSGITQIGFSAFYGCDNVETIDIPSSVSMIYSKSLLTVKRINTRYINVIGDANAINKPDITFYNKSIGYNKPANDDETYYSNAVVISINDRGTVTLSGSNAANDTSFIDNMGAGSKIYIDCTEIGGVSIGSTANPPTRFYYGGFIGTTFETIYIGPSVSKICDFAFYNIKGTNLIINNDIVLTTSYNTKDEDGIIKENGYPDGSFLIKTPFVKSNFNNIDILNCSTINENALHSLTSSKLTFYEKDVIFKIDGDNVITNTITVTNTTTLTKLSNNAFYNSTFSSIIIPSTVTKNDINCTNISNTAFLQTKGSLEINCNISSYKTDINQNPRTGILVNSEFRKIKFNYTGTIPENILYENKSIESIELGDEIRTISENAFYLCTNLTGILSLPTSMTSIHETSFIGCRFSEFRSSSNKYQIGNNGMYLLTDNGSSIALFANRHSDIQINDNTFNIDITTVNKICSYAFAYAFSDYGNSTVYAVNIPKNIKHFGSNVFYNCYKITRIIFFGSNMPNFGDDTSTAGISVYKENDFYSEINTVGSFVDLPLLKEVYIGYKDGVLLSNYLDSGDDENTKQQNTWFLHNTLRKSYTNKVPSVDGITIYVYKDLVDDYKIWEEAGYIIAIIPDDIPSPGPPVEDDDSYDADIDDPEGEEWPWDGGNGDIITNEEDHIPPVVDNSTDNDEETTDSWIKHENNVFKIPIKQLGTPAINVYGCRLDLLHLTDSYSDERTSPTPEMIVDQFGNIDFSALDYLKFNKVSNETHYGSEYDKMLKLYMGDYGNNFLIVFTVTGIDKFDATTKLFTSGVEYATHRESNWLKTEIVRITKKPESEAYYVVLLCTCLKLQNKDNYNCRSAIVSVNYGSQILDTYVNGQTTEGITTKIRVIQHKTELRLSNDTKEINITDLPTLFCQQVSESDDIFTGKFFIGFPKNFWGKDDTIKDDGPNSNKNKLREYINDYFRISYDKEKIKVVGQKTKINDLDYTYIFNLDNDNKYANIKSEGSTTSTLMTFSSCRNSDKYKDKLQHIHEEYYCVTFKIKNLKTSLAGGVWNISIYNIGEPAEMLNIHAVEDQTDIPSISVMFEGTFDVENYEGIKPNGTYNFTNSELNTNMCYAIDDLTSVRMKLALPTVVTGIPTYKKDGVIHKIYPSEELIDLCVDKSVVNMCGLSLLGNDMSGSVYNAFTTNINGTSLKLGISSNNILSNSLNNIKFVSSGSVKQSLYNYNVNASNKTRYSILENCSRTKSLIKTQRIGDSANEILENTETYIYLIDTGYSALKTENTTFLYDSYLCTKQELKLYLDKPSLHGETKLDSGKVSEKLNETIHHNENSETGVYIEANDVLTDTYYNVLAPLYDYVYENTYKGITTIDINNNVKLSNDGKTTTYNNITYNTYYCANKGGEYVVHENNVGTNQLYILKDKTNTSVNIWNSSSSQYNCGHSDYNIYDEKNKNIYAYPVYEYKFGNDNNLSCTVNFTGYADIEKIEVSDYFDEIIGKYVTKSKRVIKIGSTIEYIINGVNKTVYYDGTVYKDVDTNIEITNIIDENTTIKTIVSSYYFIYIGDDVDLSKGYIYAFNPGPNEAPADKIKILYAYSDDETEQHIIYTGGSGWYKIHYVAREGNHIGNVILNVAYDATLNDGSNLYNNAVKFYIKRDSDKIDFTPSINQLTGDKENITPKELSSIHPSLFRQIFYHLYYEIDDNGKKIKVYDDNNNNAIMHLRFMLNYDYPPIVSNFSISNIIGIELSEFEAADDWNESFNTIVVKG